MSRAEVITSNGTRLAMLLPSDGWKEGLAFLTEDRDTIQVGTWRYDSGVTLQAHKHNYVNRQVERTQEVVFVRRGRVAAHIFDEDGNLIKSLELNSGDTLVLFNGGHGYEILEDNTDVLEIKSGPYPGADVDRTRF